MITLTEVENGLKSWNWNIETFKQPYEFITSVYAFPYKEVEIVVKLTFRIKDDFLFVTTVDLIQGIKEPVRFLAFLEANDITRGCKFYIPADPEADPETSPRKIDCAFELPGRHATRELAMDMLDNLLAEIEYHLPPMLDAELLDISEISHKKK
jgi:hypothetical protein